jgi:glycosyltransferase involved in cell wall biosynthesis
VVAHNANAKGMPELEDNLNILLAGSGREMVNAIKRCLESSELRYKLGKAARQTYEEKYDGSKVADEIIDYCIW